MGRPHKGYVEWRGGEWKTRVLDGATGRTKWLSLEADLPPEQRLREDQKSLAQKLALIFQQTYVVGGFVPGSRSLTVNEFFKIWVESRRPRFPNQVDSDESAFRLWIAPELGTLPMSGTTRDRLIAFSHYLDVKAAEGVDFGAKRARNIFSVVAAMFRDAHESKDPKIRILDSNPCEDVPWPEMPEGDPLHQMLYPREFLALVACPDVPIVRARFYATSLYTTTRVGEARVLECHHVDVDNRLVKIIKAQDNGKGKRGRHKLTKSGMSRITTLEESLVPLLAGMIEERDGRGRLFPDRPADLPKGNQHARQAVEYIPGTSKVCEVFRRDLLAALKWAEIKVRPELTDDSDLRASQPIRFHDLRASGITWRHARGDNPALIRQECGHEDERTNEIYIRRLRELRPAELFPELPERLLGAAESYAQVTPNGHNERAKIPMNQCRRRESNPSDTAQCTDTESARQTEKTGRSTLDESPRAVAGSDAKSTPEPLPPNDPDEALKLAVKAAVDAGDTARAMALLEVLKATPKPAPVVRLEERRTKR